jgi:uncharacterized membrane protein
MEIVKETHIRTLTKTILYRILGTLGVMTIAYVMFNSVEVALKMGLAVVVLGSAIYYLHDRLWLFFNWKRNEKGEDSVSRSILKTILYRILVMIAAALTVKFITGSNDNTQIASFVIAQMTLNLIIYFVLERIFSFVLWGKILPTISSEQATI